MVSTISERLGVDPTDEARPHHAFAFEVALEIHDRGQECLEDVLEQRGARAGFALELVEVLEALLVDRTDPAIEDRLQESVLGPEVIVHRSQIDPGLGSHAAQGGARKAALGEELLRG